MVTPLPAKAGGISSPWLNLSAEQIVQTVWQGRVRMGVGTLFFALVGVAVAVLTPAEYVCVAKIMPEMGSGSGDMFKRLASVAGFNGMNMGNEEEVDAVRPDLYPNVLQSTPFMLHLMEQPVTTSNGQLVSIGQLVMPTEQARWSLSRLMGRNHSNAVNRSSTAKLAGPVRLTTRQRDLVEDISERIGTRLDTRSGVITITAKMPDATASAMAAQVAMDYLTKYVTNYRTEKARQDLLFYEQRLQEARQRYQAAQLNLFRYNDQHKSLVLQTATMERQRRDAELTIAQTVYTELSHQFEKAKLTVQERTPVFKVLEPAQVPLERASPRRTVMVLLFAGAGFVSSLAYLLAQRLDWIGRVRSILDGTGHPADNTTA